MMIKTIIATASVALLAGCASFYENAGAQVRMGSVLAPIEISEPTSSVKARALYSLDGIDFYAAKNCVASMSYTNAYTNSYFGVIETTGVQSGEISIQPTEASADSAQ